MPCHYISVILIRILNVNSYILNSEVKKLVYMLMNLLVIFKLIKYLAMKIINWLWAMMIAAIFGSDPSPELRSETVTDIPDAPVVEASIVETVKSPARLLYVQSKNQVLPPAPAITIDSTGES